MGRLPPTSRGSAAWHVFDTVKTLFVVLSSASCRQLVDSQFSDAHGQVQGHVAYGVKIEDRIKVRRGLKLRNAAGTMIVDTRMGREHAIGANGELSCALYLPPFPNIYHALKNPCSNHA